MDSCKTMRNISLGFEEREVGRCSRGEGGGEQRKKGRGGKKEGGEGEVTFLYFGLLHLILEILLEFSFLVVGELGEVELGLGGGGEIHGQLNRLMEEYVRINGSRSNIVRTQDG